MEREITKSEFKKLYFKYGQSKHGWTKEYWEQFYEHLEDGKFFFQPPDKGENRMFIVSGQGVHRISLLKESSEESFFEFPE